MVGEIIGSKVKKSIIGYSLFVFVLLLVYQNADAQIGHGTKEPSKASVVEMLSPSKGLLIPRVELISLTSFSPIQGELATNVPKVNSLLVYNETENIPNNLTPGYYYWTTADQRWNRLVNDADIAALGLNVTADNGLTKTGSNNIRLGGALTAPTAIGADANNTLAITGLQTGSTSDRVVVADPATGVLKQLKAALPKFFYMPSIIIPTHSSQVEPGETFGTLDLYQKYVDQFGSPKKSNPGKTTTLPVLPAGELDYYITWYDEDVFATVSVDNSGVMTYTIQPGADVTVGSFMNIVFAVKE